MTIFEKLMIDNSGFRVKVTILTTVWIFVNFGFAVSTSEKELLSQAEWLQVVLFLSSFVNIAICMLFVQTIREYRDKRIDQLREVEALLQVIGDEPLKQLLIGDAKDIIKGPFQEQTALEQRLRTVDGLSAEGEAAIAAMDEKVMKRQQRMWALHALVARATGLGTRGLPATFADIAKWDGRPIGQDKKVQPNQSAARTVSAKS